MTNLDSILKNREIILPTKVCLVKAMVFLIVMYGRESWTIKRAECWRIDAFELWCWRRLLRVPWTARRSNQSILQEINSEYSLEGLMLKLQYFGHLMWRDELLEKTLMLGEIEGRRRRGWQKMRRLDSITDSMDMSLSIPGGGEGQGSLVCCSPLGLQRVGHDWVTVQQQQLSQEAQRMLSYGSDNTLTHTSHNTLINTDTLMFQDRKTWPQSKIYFQ